MYSRYQRPHLPTDTNIILQINMSANCSKVLSKKIQRNRINFVRTTLDFSAWLDQISIQTTLDFSAWLDQISIQISPHPPPPHHPKLDILLAANCTKDPNWNQNQWKTDILFALLAYSNIKIFPSLVFPRLWGNLHIRILLPRQSPTFYLCVWLAWN